MPAKKQCSSVVKASRSTICDNISLLPLVTVVLLILVAAIMILPSCDLFENGEPDSTIPGGQGWSGRNWTVELDGAEWDDCTIAVELTITNTGDTVANFGYTDEDSMGYLYVKDKFDETFEAHKAWPWSKQFYEEKFYPDEIRSGTVEYEIDPRSEQIRLLMNPNYAGVQNLSLDLGNVPDTCE